MEGFSQPEARGHPETRGKVRGLPRLPLLVIYSSDLEEKYLAFWYRSINGELLVFPRN